jgi:N-acetylglucosaminyldiphosphoundecaprenol N-acetyl-beta-D-mannosaminyltransferase
MSDYPSWLMARLQQQQGLQVVTLNAEMAIQAENNPALAKVIHQSDLVIPDGAGVVLYLQLLRNQQIQRFPGIELAEALLYRSTQLNQPCPIFFYGGTPGAAQTAADEWQQKIPGLTIAGVQHGYLTPAEEPAFLQRLSALQPCIILVGLGVPRQELWIAEHRHLCPHAIWIGIGGSFDIWAGTKNRAPDWLRNNHLEWAYRLYQEPWRWKRMLALPKFAWRAVVYAVHS